jgi:hypothetical protein
MAEERKKITSIIIAIAVNIVFSFFVNFDGFVKSQKITFHQGFKC